MFGFRDCKYSIAVLLSDKTDNERCSPRLFIKLARKSQKRKIWKAGRAGERGKEGAGTEEKAENNRKGGAKKGETVKKMKEVKKGENGKA